MADSIFDGRLSVEPRLMEDHSISETVLHLLAQLLIVWSMLSFVNARNAVPKERTTVKSCRVSKKHPLEPRERRQLHLHWFSSLSSSSYWLIMLFTAAKSQSTLLGSIFILFHFSLVTPLRFGNREEYERCVPAATEKKWK